MRGLPSPGLPPYGAGAHAFPGLVSGFVGDALRLWLASRSAEESVGPLSWLRGMCGGAERVPPRKQELVVPSRRQGRSLPGCMFPNRALWGVPSVPGAVMRHAGSLSPFTGETFLFFLCPFFLVWRT